MPPYRHDALSLVIVVFVHSSVHVETLMDQSSTVVEIFEPIVWGSLRCALEVSMRFYREPSCTQTFRSTCHFVAAPKATLSSSLTYRDRHPSTVNPTAHNHKRSCVADGAVVDMRSVKRTSDAFTILSLHSQSFPIRSNHYHCESRL